MKKFLLALFCLTAAMVSVAQKTAPAKEKTPTKQETMDWIAGKMKEYLTPSRTFISYSDGKFTYKREWKAFVYCETTLDLNRVTGISSEYSKDLYISGKGLSFSHCDGDEPGHGSSSDNISISGPDYNDYGAPFNFTPDNSMVERMRKALTALMNFNSAKKTDKESF